MTRCMSLWEFRMTAKHLNSHCLSVFWSEIQKSSVHTNHAPLLTRARQFETIFSDQTFDIVWRLYTAPNIRKRLNLSSSYGTWHITVLGTCYGASLVPLKSITCQYQRVRSYEKKNGCYSRHFPEPLSNS